MRVEPASTSPPCGSGIVYGPSPVEHERPESQTVVDKFRRLAAAGAELTVDDPAATIGVVHVEDAARILLEAGPGVANVVAETVTVGDVAAPRARRGGRPDRLPARTRRRSTTAIGSREYLAR